MILESNQALYNEFDLLELQQEYIYTKGGDRNLLPHFPCTPVSVSQLLKSWIFENEEIGNLRVSGCGPTELVSLGFAWEEM